ncbi:unnamed protein product [Bursaphelenchus okinawaensis]|uniref:ascorbate ferrireductase (transmembrane) n=1 Tax=Bursaphelenchus okinawaensis TaxID=465554 RepID=A0A811KCA1_9BILA|nr:unnamed protein product [Bursaphelenchus okinawaensis]CAG9097899.1 unnamed protein product [Bursaphelenchus okinawaensis]
MNLYHTSNFNDIPFKIIIIMFTLSLFTQPTNTQTYDGKTFNRNDCEKTKGCLFHPPKCKLYNNCYYAFSYVTDSNRLYMEIYGNLNYVQADYGAYVAVGFSTDELMGMDTVTECSSFQGRPFQGRLSSNPGKSNRRVTVDEISHDIMLQTISSHYSNKTLYCLLSQSIYPINGIKDYYVRPLNEEYFLLFASGLTDGEELVVHALDVKLSNFPFVTQHPVNLKAFHADNLADLFNSTSLSSFNTTDIGEPSEGSFNKSAKVLRMDSTIDHATESHRSVRDRQQEGVHFQTRIRLTTAHGITMCFSWLVLVPLAILIARYGRRIWGPDKRLLNVPIWIHCHRLCNILACVIMTFSTVAIFAAHGWHWHGLEFTHGSTLDLHGFLGLFAVIFAWSQVLNSIFRCKLGSSLRKCHNFLHRTVGLVTVILGCKLDFTAYIVINFVTFELLVHLVQGFKVGVV